MSPRLPIICLLLLLLSICASGQRYVVEQGDITFTSKATIEDIKSENKKVNSIFNPTTGNIAFSVPIREFHFEKQLMQEHFNDKYMESQKFPVSTFSGKVIGYDATRAGAQNVHATGRLIIHGITKDVDIPGIVEVDGEHIVLKSTFKVKLSEFGVVIPKLLWQNIAEQVDVIVNLKYKQQ